MRVYVKTNTDAEYGFDFVHHYPFHKEYGLGKTEEELLEEGVLIDEPSQLPYREDKMQVLKYTEDKGLFYEYEDIPEEPISLLEGKVAELEDVILMLTM